MSSSALLPNPFHAPDPGPWEPRMRPIALAAIIDALRRYRAGEITEAELRKDKNRVGIKYWLWYMHHPDNERWKNIGRPYWSHDAYTTWRRYYFAVPENKRIAPRDRGPAYCTLPKKSWAGPDGLLHEHVVPQKVSLNLLINDGVDPQIVLARNIGAVITVREDRRLPSKSNHLDPNVPWLRYAGTGIRFISNPNWSVEERAALARYDLLFHGDIEAFPRAC
jgi:hypothetical protein